MQIDLTDHLRCPSDHAEAFLVLLPDRMEGRDVVAGHLGCPVCGWSTDWQDSVPRFGAGHEAAGRFPLDAEGAAALLGLGGPGGWVGLAGSAGTLAPALQQSLEGVSLVAVNPPADLAVGTGLSLLRADRWPLKRHALRGVLLGEDALAWWRDAIGSVLPGLRLVGAGPAPEGLDVLAATDGVWLAQASSR
jgi:hypothetical protein